MPDLGSASIVNYYAINDSIRADFVKLVAFDHNAASGLVELLYVAYLFVVGIYRLQKFGLAQRHRLNGLGVGLAAVHLIFSKWIQVSGNLPNHINVFLRYLWLYNWFYSWLSHLLLNWLLHRFLG